MLKIFTSRRFRQGSAATAITAAFIVLIIVFNMLVSAVSSRYSLSLDLTENKIFGISDETKSFLAALDKDVEIFIMNTEEAFTSGGDYFVQANEVIKKYASTSPHVKVFYIDLVRNPSFAAGYPDLQLNTSTILVASGGKTAELTPYDLYNVQSDYYGNEMIASSKAEEAMTSALLKVTSDKVVAVSMLTGHGESELSGLRSLLEMNNYVVTEQNLLTEEVDPNSKIAILAAPVRDLNEDALKKLDKFLSNDSALGKTLIYAPTDSQPELPNLSAFLADWGIEVGGGIVFESALNRVFNLNYYMTLVDYNEDVYAKKAMQRGMYTIMPYAKPLTALFETKGARKIEAPLMFSQTAGIVPPGASSDWQPSQADITGPFPALIVSSETAYVNNSPSVSNVVACSSVFALEDDLLASTSIANGDYFLGMINVLSEREDVISIQSKSIGGNELGIQTGQVYAITFLLAILLPLFILVAGVVIWLRRRHL